jgi:hypothetical protein
MLLLENNHALGLSHLIFYTSGGQKTKELHLFLLFVNERVFFFQTDLFFFLSTTL